MTPLEFLRDLWRQKTRIPGFGHFDVDHKYDGRTDRQNHDSIHVWSHHEETRELPAERDNARNTARCTQARKTMHGLDGQHQYVDRTPRGRVNQNDIGQRNGEITSMVWPTQASDRGRLKNRIGLQ